jgi:hypothetical protein
VALEDAFDRQVGSINTRSVPWLLVLRRGPDGWKLASLRVVSNVAQSDRFRQPF